MKQKIVALALAAGMLSGCATLSASVGNRTRKPDQSVVESFVSMGDGAGARDYLVRFGIPEYEVIERVQQARQKVVNDAKAAKK